MTEHNWRRRREQKRANVCTVSHDGASWCVVLAKQKTGAEVARIRIDGIDMPRVAQHAWTPSSAVGYAMATVDGRHVHLHRFVMDDPPGLEVDHIDGDPTNCRRHNLRIVPRVGNAQNVLRTNTTGYRNVYFCRDAKRRKPYQVRVLTKTGHKLGGYFATLEEAHEAAVALRAKHFSYVNEERHAKRQTNRRKKHHPA